MSKTIPVEITMCRFYNGDGGGVSITIKEAGTRRKLVEARIVGYKDITDLLTMQVCFGTAEVNSVEVVESP